LAGSLVLFFALRLPFPLFTVSGFLLMSVGAVRQHPLNVCPPVSGGG